MLTSREIRTFRILRIKFVKWLSTGLPFFIDFTRKANVLVYTDFATHGAELYPPLQVAILILPPISAFVWPDGPGLIDTKGQNFVVRRVTIQTLTVNLDSEIFYRAVLHYLFFFSSNYFSTTRNPN